MIMTTPLVPFLLHTTMMISTIIIIITVTVIVKSSLGARWPASRVRL